LDFKAAFLAFFSVNVALMSLGATLLWSVASKSDPLSPRALLLALGFSGVIDNLQLGQIGLMLFFCVAGFIWAAHHKKYVLAGLFLVPMSVKLHLLFLFLTVLLVWIVQKRHWQILISGALGFVALVGVTVLLSPEVVGQWREAFEVPPFYWRTASLAGATRGALHFLTGEAPIWPLWCFPLVGVIGVLLWLWISKPVLRWEIHAPGLIALSLMASPYGWLFDQTLLLPIHLLLAARALEPGVHRRVRLESLGGLLLVQAVAFGALMNGIVDHRLFFWQPVVLFLLWLRGNRMLSSSAS
jgi:hypothetical protein